MTRLLLLHHTPTPATELIGAAIARGAGDPQIEGVEVVVASPLAATAADVLNADALVLGTPANFGYMSGALKHFFDSTFLQLGGALSDDGAGAESAGPAGIRFGLWVHGRYDTEGAIRSVLSITGALGWKQSAPVLSVLGDVTDRSLDQAWELGATMAAWVSS